jgi:putative effector of murein hydrolase
MDTAKFMGASPELAADIVILTCIVGAVLCSFIFRLLSIKSQEAQGIALGSVAHVVGTARHFK